MSENITDKIKPADTEPNTENPDEPMLLNKIDDMTLAYRLTKLDPETLQTIFHTKNLALIISLGSEQIREMIRHHHIEEKNDLQPGAICLNQNKSVQQLYLYIKPDITKRSSCLIDMTTGKCVILKNSEFVYSGVDCDFAKTNPFILDKIPLKHKTNDIYI